MESHGVITLTGKDWRTRRKPVPVPLHPPQIPHGHGLTRVWTRDSAVRDDRITTWAMPRPSDTVTVSIRLSKKWLRLNQDSAGHRLTASPQQTGRIERSACSSEAARQTFSKAPATSRLPTFLYLQAYLFPYDNIIHKIRKFPAKNDEKNLKQYLKIKFYWKM
jgi:hypothetical protein